MPPHPLHISKSLADELGLQGPPYGKVQRIRVRRMKRRNAMSFLLANDHSLPETYTDEEKTTQSLPETHVQEDETPHSLPETSVDDERRSSNIETNVIATKNSSSVEGKIIVISPERHFFHKEEPTVAKYNKRKDTFKQEEGRKQLLLSVLAAMTKKEDVVDEEPRKNLYHQEETSQEESRRLFWTSNQRIKEERQRRESLEKRESLGRYGSSKKKGGRRSLTLPSQYLQNFPKMLNNLFYDEDYGSDFEDEEIMEMEIISSFKMRQSNNIHNLRRHSHYE